MFDLKKAGITLAAAYAAAYALKSSSVKLKNFSASEFGVWWPFVDSDLLRGLDRLRDALGVPLVISPAPGAIGRTGSQYKTSQHYLSGVKVRAIDVLIPENITLLSAYNVARSLNVFSGIGVYPDWQPSHGLHLDTRENATPAAPALWSGIKTANGQVYRSLSEGFA